MSPPFRIICHDYFGSVETVLAIWCGAMLAIVVAVTRSPRRIGRWRILLRNEGGAAYTLSYVLAFPIYFILMFAIVQSTIILIVKMGTVYAAYAAARSAVVWLPAEPESGTGEQRIRRAAVHALVPFGSSSSLHAKWWGGTASAEANEYIQAYQAYARGGATPKYLRAKYRCAEVNTAVDVTPKNPAPHEDVAVTVRYRMPLYFAWFGRLLDLKSGDGEPRFHTIATTVTLQSETPIGYDIQTDNPLGIDYRSP